MSPCDIKRNIASALPKTTLQVLLGTPLYTNKEPQGLLLKALKMAATYSPTMRSTIGVAELGVARSPPLPCLPPLPPLHSPLPALLPACCLLRWADTARPLRVHFVPSPLGSPSPRSQTLLGLDFIDSISLNSSEDPFH